MSSEDREFIIFKVKLLLMRIAEGKAQFVADRMPKLIKALEAVRFDSDGNPTYESITAPVRGAADVIYRVDVEQIEKEAEDRERKSPVHKLLRDPVEVNDKILKEYADKGDIDSLAFELYKETATVLTITSHASNR